MNNSYITTELTRIMEEYDKFKKDNIVPYITNISENIDNFLVKDDFRSYKIYINNVYHTLLSIVDNPEFNLINKFFNEYIKELYRFSTGYYCLMFISGNHFSSIVIRTIDKMNSFVKSLS